MHTLEGVGRLAAVSLLVALAAVAGCASAASEGDAADDDALGVVRSEVQVQGVGYQFAVVQDGSRAAKSTGALEVPLRKPDGTIATITSHQPPFNFPVLLQMRGTCGVTFISPHYAITAAHCVDGTNVPDPANNTLAVNQYDVSTANLSSIYLASQVNGLWPDYQPAAGTMNSVPGYVQTSYSCKVVSRCSYTTYNCTTGGDVAMLYCGNRPSGASWLPVATTEQSLGDVEMYWFHELLATFPIQPVISGTTSDFDRWNHYGALGTNSNALTNQMANWHYVAARTNGLLPLKSIPFSNGVQHRRINNFGGTDLFGCHGTSGSGVLQRGSTGELELLGPAANPGWTTATLCNHPYNLQPGGNGLTYTANSYVQQLQSKYSRSLLLDRNPIVFDPGGPILVAN